MSKKITQQQLDKAREVIEYIISETKISQPDAIVFINAGEQFLLAMPFDVDEI